MMTLPIPSRRAVRGVLTGILLATVLAVPALAQDKPQKPDQEPGAQGHHAPPPSAYEDCKGKKPGERVQHTTPQGTVSATCEPSPEGMVARPDQPPPR
jgi:hypothetical protein